MLSKRRAVLLQILHTFLVVQLMRFLAFPDTLYISILSFRALSFLRAASVRSAYCFSICFCLSDTVRASSARRSCELLMTGSARFKWLAGTKPCLPSPFSTLYQSCITDDDNKIIMQLSMLEF